MDDIFNKQFWISQWEGDQTGDTYAVHKGYSTAGYWDKAALSYDQDKSEVKNRRLEKSIAVLKEKGLLFDGVKVLDIGCGTGTLSIELARNGAVVTGLDFSKGMLAQFKSNIPRELESRITLLKDDWHSLDIRKKGWEKSFDLVIAFMSPGVSTPKAFFDMMACSRDGCAIRGWAKKANNPILEALWPQIVGAPLEDKPQSILYKINLLFSLGFFPDITFDMVEWNQATTFQDEFDRQVAFFEKIDNKADKKVSHIVRSYLMSIAEGDRIQRRHKGLTATAIWRLPKREGAG